MGNICNIYDDCFKPRTCACSRKSEKQYAGQIDSVFNNSNESVAFTESNGKYTRIDYVDL